MHQSEAKAVVKGAMRRVGHRWDELETTFRPVSESGSPLIKTKKKFLRYIDEVIKFRGELLIHKVTSQQRNSWHQKIELASLSSEYEDVDGVGSVAKISVCFTIPGSFLKVISDLRIHIMSVDYICMSTFWSVWYCAVDCQVSER